VPVLSPREAKRIERVKQFTAQLAKEMDYFIEAPMMAEFLGGPYSLVLESSRPLRSIASIKGKRKLEEIKQKL
jgi:hypothetical protein